MIWPLASKPLLPDYPGSFGAVRAKDHHTGIDLYCPPRTEVRAIEAGVIVGVEAFTGAWVPGEDASPWWNDTMAVLVRGESGIIVYGEVAPVSDAKSLLGQNLAAGEVFGKVGCVLKSNKGRPMIMLHIELLAGLPEGYTGTYFEEGERSATSWWLADEPQPDKVRDPAHLLGYAPTFDLSRYDGVEFNDPLAERKDSEWWKVWGGDPTAKPRRQSLMSDIATLKGLVQEAFLEGCQLARPEVWPNSVSARKLRRIPETHPAVIVVVKHPKNGMVLMLQRYPFDRAHPDPQGDGLWCFPGGKLEPNELVLWGAHRELEEETGLQPISCLRLPDEGGICRAEAKISPDSLVDLRLSSEHKAWRWMTPDECLQLRLAGPVTKSTLELILSAGS